MSYSDDRTRAERILARLSDLQQTRDAPEDLRLGKMALEKNLITDENLRECLEAREKERRQGRNVSLGTFLVDKGFLKAEDLILLLEEGSGPAGPVPGLSRYDIRKHLGEGATAVVYQAWDRELQRNVAIKVLREQAAFSEIARERFRREAATAAGLTHAHLVQVHDAGEAGGRLYIVMELVEGRSLSEILKERKTPEADLVRILEKAARGLAEAHDKGIVHRDLKPANILVGMSGEPKVGDFGLAHLLESPTQLTRTGTTLGTPLYMSPEQVEGRPKEISPRTDVYALGAMLYEILTTRPPHQGETLAEIYGKIVREDPIAPRKLKADVSPDLETIARKALEKNPLNRYASAKDFAEDLRCALEREPIRARPISVAEQIWRKVKKHRTILLPVSGAIVLGILMGILAARKTPAPAGLIFLERLEGVVNLVAPERAKKAARQGQTLAAGEGVETGPVSSLAALRFEDGTKLDLGSDTAISDLSAGPQKKLTLTKGWLRGDIDTPQEQPMTLVTPHGKIRIRKGFFFVILQPDPGNGLRLEVVEGSAELTDRGGISAVVDAGCAGLAAPGVAPTSKPYSRHRPAAFIYRLQKESWGAVSQTVSLAPHRTYILSAWFATGVPFAGGSFGVRTESGSILAEQRLGASEGYHRSVLTFDSGPNQKAIIFSGVVGFDYETASGSWVSIDDWSLTEKGGDGRNFVSDPDYELQLRAHSGPWSFEGSRIGEAIAIDPGQGRIPSRQLPGVDRK